MAHINHPAESTAQRPEGLELAGLVARVDEALRVELEQQEPPETDGDGFAGEVMGRLG